MRNPKDQFVSWYNFRLELTPAFVGEEMQELHPADWDGFLRTHVAGSYTEELRWAVLFFCIYLHISYHEKAIKAL